jgi:hypothetical protein
MPSTAKPSMVDALSQTRLTLWQQEVDLGPASVPATVVDQTRLFRCIYLRLRGAVVWWRGIWALDGRGVVHPLSPRQEFECAPDVRVGQLDEFPPRAGRLLGLGSEGVAGMADRVGVAVSGWHQAQASRSLTVTGVEPRASAKPTVRSEHWATGLGVVL